MGIVLSLTHRSLYCVKNNYLKEKWLDGSTEKFIYYYYDESGVSGFNFNGQDYHYQKNILGDIIAIYNTNGNKICYYKYDAWGNHKVFDGSTNLDITNNTGAPVLIGGVYANTHTHIGNINSFRYRGYYYDIEIGMYYLQSRYYDPQVGRFINADDVEYLEPEVINGLNLYAYCLNNPVMYIDSTGCSPFWDKFRKGLMIVGSALAIVGGAVLIATGVGAIAGGALIGFGVGSLIGGFYNESQGGSFAAGWAIGGTIGAVAGGLIAWAAPAIGSFLSHSFTLGTFAKASGDVMSMVAIKVTGAQIVKAGLGLTIIFAKDPFIKSLEKGMSQNQKEKFNEEIHDIKRGEGRGGADNLDKDLIRKIAEWIKRTFR